MGWFDEQIRQRKLSDQEVFEDSLFQMAAVVLGDRAAEHLNNERLVTKKAIDDILKYYRFKPVEVPSSIEDGDEQLDYCLHNYGIMRRNVTLEENWYQDAFGPMIGFWSESKLPVALLPAPLYGYYYFENGKKISINKKNAFLLSRDAICFYRPLPAKKLGIPDLLVYIRSCFTLGDSLSTSAIAFLASFVGLMSPRIIKIMSGMVVQTGKTSFLAGTALFLLAVTIVSHLLSSVQTLVSNRVETKTSISVEAAMMMRILSLPAPFFRQFSSGELADRLGSVNDLCSLLLGTLLTLGVTAITSLLYLAQISSMVPALTAPALLIIVASLVLSIVSSLVQMKITRSSMQEHAALSGMNYAAVSGIQKIKLAGAEKRVFARWASSYAREAAFNYSPPFFLKINNALNLLITTGGTVLIYYLAVKSNVSTSSYFAFSFSFGAISAAFSSLASAALSLAEIKPILEMAEPILKAEPEIQEHKEILTHLSGNVELSNVSFRYQDDSPNIVDDLSLKIRAGEYIAIVGKTGCGKSTLIRLMLGFEKPTRGAVYYDGKDLNKIDLQSLRRRIGVVTQDGSLFQGDIFSNISVSAPQMSMEDAWAAAEIAGIADDIRAMPMGMFTIISEGQGGISGGQKQRLMIARAIAHKPKILILDEATSALDNRTQKMVSDALERMGCTRIVVAHRLSTIRHCDRILVLDQGKIIEEGTYEELIEHGGFFSDLVSRQRLDVPQK